MSLQAATGLPDTPRGLTLAAMGRASNRWPRRRPDA